MALTKAEFDKWKAKRQEALAAIDDRPLGITGDGYLSLPSTLRDSAQTRDLYEMLREWYGEKTMTEKAEAVIEAAMLRDDMREAGHGGTNDHRIAGEQLEDACSAYRAEQKQ